MYIAIIAKVLPSVILWAAISTLQYYEYCNRTWNYENSNKFECQAPVDLARLDLIDSSLTGREPDRWTETLAAVAVKSKSGEVEASQDRSSLNLFR